MKTLSKLFAVVALSVIVVGCASTGDVEKLQSQIDVLKTSVSTVETTAKQAQESASDAAQRAAAASAAANRAAQYSQETSSHLDSLFHRAMVK